jgi:hypothetical protein
MAGFGSGRSSLVRMLDSRVATAAFRSALNDMSSAIARNPAPRLLRIQSHGFSGDHYYVEYLNGAPVHSVPEYFSRAHWLNRLQFVRGMTADYKAWQQAVAPPIGPHGGRIVACNIRRRWYAHLAPCPPIPLVSPCDLWPADPDVLASIAPERLRGVAGYYGRTEDVYAAGSMVLQALGLRPPTAGIGRDARLEDQARGHFTGWDFENSEIERTLWSVPRFRETLRVLADLVRRCTAFVPAARPDKIQELDEALGSVLACQDNSAVFARDLDDRGRLPDALQFIEWALTLPGTPAAGRPSLHSLAANYCARLRMPARELHHVEELIELEPSGPAARRRVELLYDSYLSKSHSPTAATDTEGDLLLKELKELERFRPPDPEDHSLAKAELKEDRMRAAMIHGRRGDLHSRARVFYDIAQSDVSDIDSLYLYLLSLRDLEDQTKDRTTLDTAIRGAIQRVKNMAQAGVVSQEEANIWIERFQSLRQY